MRTLSVCVLIVMGLVCDGSAREARVDRDDALRQRVQDAMPVPDSFWGAILVVKEGRVVVQQGFGPQDPNDLQSRAIDGESLFDLASISKPLTATAIMLLAQEGQLSLDDPIERWSPIAIEPATGITIRHLLAHTSGKDAQDGGISAYDEPSMEAAWREFVRCQSSAEPGAAWSYHNGAYCLASIVERASGVPFDKFMLERVLKPIGMTRSGLPLQGHMDRTRATVRAPGITALDHPWGWGARGCTGVITCMADVVAWDAAICGETLLKREWLEQMHTGLGYRSGASYGMGWYVDATAAETPRLWHTGGTFGYRSYLVRLPVEGVLIAVLADQRTNVRSVAMAIEAAVLSASSKAGRVP